MVLGITGKKYTGKSTLAKELISKGFVYYDISNRIQHILNTHTDLIEKTVKLFSNRVYVGETFSFEAAMPYMITDEDYLHRHQKNIDPYLSDDFQLFLDRMIHKDLFVIEGPIVIYPEIMNKIQYLIGLEGNNTELYRRIREKYSGIKDMEISFLLETNNIDLDSYCNITFNVSEKNWLEKAKKYTDELIYNR